jgi:tetratricopeptide (TPR) repeat protein
VSGRPSAVSNARRPGRNDPCICGSGRKSKLCCGAAATQTETANHQTSALLPRSTAPELGEGSNRLGPLTEVSALRETAEQFMRLQSAPPVARTLTGGAPAARHTVTPDRSAAAQRYRERGISLVEAGRPSAAISAFRRAIELDPGEAASHHALGRALLRLNRPGEAAASLSLATTFRDDAAAYHDLAVALQRQDLRVEATAAYRRAVELAPELAEAHAALGELLILAAEDEEAARCFRRAAAADPDTVAGRFNLAKACILETNFSEAETQLRQALAREPQNDLLTKYLGDVLARQGRFDEAGEAFDRTLELNPRHVKAHFTIVEARKCTEADRPRLGPMLAALDDPGLGDEDRLQLHFAIGKLLDDLGDYAEAMRHFDVANQRRRAAFDRA